MSRIGSAIAVFAAVRCSPAAASEPCEPAVEIIGARELAADLVVELAVVGVSSHGGSGCPRLRVAAHRTEAGAIELVLSDPRGRAGVRMTGTVAGAAAVIASWLRETRFTLAFDPPASSASARGPDGEREERVRASPRGGFGLAFGAAVDSHKLLWRSVSLSGCVPIGRICVGALVRGATARSFDATAPLSDTVISDAEGYDVVATVGVAHAMGTWMLSPELMGGYGRMSLSWQPRDLLEFGDYGGLEGVRLGARAVATKSIGKGYSVELSLAAEALVGNLARRGFGDRWPIGRFGLHPLVRASLGIRHGR